MRFLKRNTHPMRIEELANRISSLSSIFILVILALPVIIPRLF